MFGTVPSSNGKDPDRVLIKALGLCLFFHMYMGASVSRLDVVNKELSF